jgi:hypothetical protein
VFACWIALRNEQSFAVAVTQAPPPASSAVLSTTNVAADALAHKSAQLAATSAAPLVIDMRGLFTLSRSESSALDRESRRGDSNSRPLHYECEPGGRRRAIWLRLVGRVRRVGLELLSRGHVSGHGNGQCVRDEGPLRQSWSPTTCFAQVESVSVRQLVPRPEVRGNQSCAELAWSP